MNDDLECEGEFDNRLIKKDLKGRGRISNGKWASKDSLAILSGKVRGAFLKQIQVKLCILKLVLKRKYCKMLYRSGT
jgi:hypothetical protein